MRSRQKSPPVLDTPEGRATKGAAGANLSSSIIHPLRSMSRKSPPIGDQVIELMRDARRRYHLALAEGRKADAAEADADYWRAFELRRQELLRQAEAVQR